MKIALLALFCGFIGACSLAGGLGGKPEAVIYDLNASEATKSLKGRISRQIIIAEPKTLDALQGKAVAVKSTSSRTLSFLPVAEWVDNLPIVVQTQIVRSFENAGALGRIGVPGEQLRSDLLVVSDIRAFNIESDGINLTAVVEISYKVINDQNGAVSAAKVFSSRVPVTGDGSDAIVSGLNNAFADTLVELVKWTSARF